VVVNCYGRQWEEFDSIRAQALINGAFTLSTEDGVPLCGRYIENEQLKVLTANGWRSR